jgi:hypothetical protein
MKTKALPHTPEPTEEEIRHTAYLLWLENGREPGHDLDHWLAAKELLRHRHAPAADGKRRANKIPPAIPTSA